LFIEVAKLNFHVAGGLLGIRNVILLQRGFSMDKEVTWSATASESAASV
jgi:hypothetical protein